MIKIQKAKARVVKNTRRKGSSRIENLYDFAELILVLKNHYGSIKEVSQQVADISPNMLNRFLSALNVDEKIVPLIKSRKIDNINVLYYIQTLKPADQVYLAKLVSEKRINSTDIRAIKPLRRKFPNKSIKEICKIVLDSKDKRRYLVKFELSTSKRLPQIKDEFKKYISTSDFEIKKEKNIGILLFSEYGYKSIRKHCKDSRKSYDIFIKSIINTNK